MQKAHRSKVIALIIPFFPAKFLQNKQKNENKNCGKKVEVNLSKNILSKIGCKNKNLDKNVVFRLLRKLMLNLGFSLFLKNIVWSKYPDVRLAFIGSIVSRAEN